MNSFIKGMINKKLKNVNPKELLEYSKQYQIPISEKQANQISSYLSNTNLDPLSEQDRMKLFKKLAQLTDLKTAQQAQKLFNKLIKEHGVESWFK
ncbi:DUF2624 domain-containing protein [Aquibacillus kalidii]|uniref:DUF2624 domain-containing protein n=1 Tax=Aquibacillus kalidii TaxID=2762597 RepID=UPI001645802F|nr:DUF2624 family protein [Aquibacillus kalidii]